MSRNAFLDETRTERIDLGLPFLKQIRVSPTISALLMEEKPANQTWGDFFLTAAVNHIFHARNMRGDWRGCNRLMVRLLGPEPDGLGVTTEEQLEAMTSGGRSDNCHERGCR
jgi:hypothetical protein